MSEPSELELYLHLARASELRRQSMERDKLLVLAGVAAAEAGLEEIAACCRRKILEHNAGHLVRHFPSFAAASGQERFDVYLKKLRREFPREKAEHMLRSLGIADRASRAAHLGEYEYAAALLGTTPEQLHAAGATTGAPPAAPLESKPTNWRAVGVLAAALLGLAALTAWLYFG